MREARAIFSAAATLRERLEPFFVATVVRVEGSSYRRPGARLIATKEGRVAGNVSGGCLENDLVRTGFWRTRNGPVVVRYDSTDPSEVSLGCGGVVDVLVEQAGRQTSGDPLELLSRAIASERRTAMATVFRTTDDAVPIGARWFRGDEGLFEPLANRALDAAGERVFSRHADVVAGEHAEARQVETSNGVIEVLIEPIVPPPHLFVLGAGLDVVPLAAFARNLGWSVTIWDASPSFASRSRFAGVGVLHVRELAALRAAIDASHRAVTVVAGHHLVNDRAALLMAVASRARYIGVLGPRHRTVSLVSDVPAVLDDPRVHAPVGLDLGAETPEEIALSITAEMLADLQRGSGTSLRDRRAIHEAAARCG